MAMAPGRKPVGMGAAVRIHTASARPQIVVWHQSNAVAPSWLVGGLVSGVPVTEKPKKVGASACFASRGKPV